MRNIYINGRFLSRRPTGVDRYAIETIKAIESRIKATPSLKEEFKFTIIAPQGTPKPKYLTEMQFISRGSLSGTLWEQITLPTLAINGLLINFCNTAPILKRNQIVVIHDATTVRVPEAFSRNFVRWYKFLIPLLLKRSRYVATVSNFSKSEIKACYGTDRSIHVVREGADHFTSIQSSTDIKSKFGLDRPFVLAVGSLAPHKNFKTLVGAMARLTTPPFDCVIAGGTDPKVFASDENGLPTWVKHVGYVSDEELKALYQNALLFVFPSTYEGYGLPPTEAMSLGCPVLSSNTASMPEVCADAASYFDPNNEIELAKTLNDVATDKSLLLHLKQKGEERSNAMTWQNSAEDIINILTNGNL